MWNLNYSNSSCNNFEQFRAHKHHLEKLLSSKSIINNKHSSKSSTIIHFKPNKTQLNINSPKNIQYSNTILFKRINDISSKPSPYSRSILKPIYCPVFDKTSILWQKKKKRMMLMKENALLNKRFLNSKSFYSTKSFEIQNDFYRYLESNMSQKVPNPNLYFKTFSTFKKKVSNDNSHHSIMSSNSPLSRSHISIFKPYNLDHSVTFKLTNSSMKNNKKRYSTLTVISNKTKETQSTSVKEL